MPLVVQFSVKFERLNESKFCAGGYMKLLPADINLTDFHRDSNFYIMFGPDICLEEDQKLMVQLILNRKTDRFKKHILPEFDRMTHYYTLLINQNNTYSVYIDGNLRANGAIEKDYEVVYGKWREKSGTKFSSRSDLYPTCSEDSKDQTLPCRSQADIEINPDFEAKHLHIFDNIGAVGIEAWQSTSGVIFDNFLITNDIHHALTIARKTINLLHNSEKLALSMH